MKKTLAAAFTVLTFTPVLADEDAPAKAPDAMQTVKTLPAVTTTASEASNRKRNRRYWIPPNELVERGLSIHEFRALESRRIDRRFIELDKDGNGFLSEDELAGRFDRRTLKSR